MLWLDQNQCRENLLQERADLSIKEAKLKKVIKLKEYLIILKYIIHIEAFLYMIYTIFQFLDIDLIILGHLTHISILSWIFMYVTSLLFKFCYVHRLPLYYIALNDSLTILDYYVGIPVSINNLLLIHLLLIILLIFGYSIFYIKLKKNAKYLKKSSSIVHY